MCIGLIVSYKANGSGSISEKNATEKKSSITESSERNQGIVNIETEKGKSYFFSSHKT